MLTYGNTFAILKTWLRGNQATINNSAAKESRYKNVQINLSVFQN
nr:MAG TPA: hypothetical protein [Caudoviricetes sp.]DAS47411.1 MAG TPA: hypothetical protein [Caudoviricetes sp.]DAS55065.1 MAG TPA: hypothetical protein [Caudoviricetes sp.]